MIGWFRITLMTLYRTCQNWNRDDGPQLAAAVSYYMALSFFPLLLILLSASGFVLRFTGWGQDAQVQLIDLIRSQAGPSLASQVHAALQSVQSKAALSGPLGLAALLMAAMLIFAQFDRAFDRIWNVPQKTERGIWATIRNVLWYRLRAFLMLLGVGMFVVAAFIATMSFSVAQGVLYKWLPLPTVVWKLVELLPAIGINWLLFTVIYRTLPKVPVRSSHAAAGGLLTSLLWETGRRLLASLVIGGQYSAYGVVGAFIAVMLWVYYAVTLIFLGAEFVQVIGERAGPGGACGQSRAKHQGLSD